MNDKVIKINGLGKQYRLGERGASYATLRDSLSNLFKRTEKAQREYIWAIKDVSLEVEKGEILGIIGRNGAGKSTLLKILSQITEPTEGEAELQGRVGSLLEVGTGFHQELTGRENIFLNGAILGMSKREISAKFDEIVAFAEIEKFMDTPVKFYSSGMYVRLAFAVAAHLEPEILLIDEVLAVGDAGFQKKCLGKMEDVAKSGRTVLFVSHNMGAVSELCTRAILLDQGSIVSTGEVPGVLSDYSHLTSQDGLSVDLKDDPALPSAVVGIKLQNGQGDSAMSFDIKEDISIKVTYRVKEKLPGLVVALILSRNMTNLFYTFHNDGGDTKRNIIEEPGLYESEHKIPKGLLKAGSYSVRINLGIPARLIQSLNPALQFTIEELSENTFSRGYRRERPGHIIAPGVWKTKKVE